MKLHRLVGGSGLSRSTPSSKETESVASGARKKVAENWESRQSSAKTTTGPFGRCQESYSSFTGLIRSGGNLSGRCGVSVAGA